MVIGTLIDRLVSRQNRDGGWAYGSGGSWTEPTAFAILALQSARSSAESIDRARSWLRKIQRDDGGWPPAPEVDQSTSVTSAAVLALLGSDECKEQDRLGLSWILKQAPLHETLSGSLLRLIFNLPRVPSPSGGASWFPGTAAWVAPTAMKLLVLSNRVVRGDNRSGNEASASAREFLLRRRLPDGGWNHGGAYASGEIVHSYPETTGLTLLALQGVDRAKLRSSLARAQSFFMHPGSLEAWAWLTMALSSYGLKPNSSVTSFKPWTSRDLALAILALTADHEENLLTQGRNV